MEILVANKMAWSFLEVIWNKYHPVLTTVTVPFHAGFPATDLPKKTC
jgi:hypothetical protein